MKFHFFLYSYLIDDFRSHLNAYCTIASLFFCLRLDMLMLNGVGGPTFVAREDAIRVKNFIRNPSSGRQGEGGDELTPTQHASGSFDAVCPLSFPLCFKLRTFEKLVKFAECPTLCRHVVRSFPQLYPYSYLVHRSQYVATLENQSTRRTRKY